MKKLQTLIGAVAIASAMALVGCATSTKETIIAPQVDAVDTSTIKPTGKVPEGRKAIGSEQDFAAVFPKVAQSVTKATGKGSALETELTAFLGANSEFYKDVIKPFVPTDKNAQTHSANLDLNGKEYKSTNDYAKINIKTGKVDYKFASEQTGTNISVNGVVDGNALVNFKKADSNCLINAASANVKAVANSVNININPTSQSFTASGNAAVAVKASAYFDDKTYAGFMNLDANLVILDANAVVAKVMELAPQIQEIIGEDGSKELTAEDIKKLIALYDQLPVTLSAKLTTTDVKGENPFVAVSFNSFTEIYNYYEQSQVQKK